MAEDARWRHTVAGIKMGGFGDGGLPLLLREAERLGGHLLVEGLPAGTPLMAKAAMIELVDVLFEAGMCSLKPGSGARELAEEPTARQTPWRSTGGAQADHQAQEEGQVHVNEVLQQAAELLKGGTFQQVFEALEMVDMCRHELFADTLAEAVLMDRLEAEGLRRYAHHQAEAERYGFAIDGYLEKAIKLDPRRAELYADRARFRLQQACPWLPQDGVFPSEASRAEALQALEDCRLALSLDASLAEAYELQLPVLLASGDLAEAQRVASLGAAAAGDPARAQVLRREHGYARMLHGGLERAEALLTASERQPAEAERVIMGLLAEAGPRLEPPLQRRLEGLLHRARMQRNFEDAYIDKAAKARFDNSWAQLFDPRMAASHKAQDEASPKTPGPPPPRPRGEQVKRSGHGWGTWSGDSATDGQGAGGRKEEGRPGGAWRGGPGNVSEFPQAAAKPKAGATCQALGAPPQGLAGNGGGLAPERWEEQFPLIIAGIERCLEGLQGRDRSRMLRQLFLEWHPDKRPREEGLATKVFQWLQEVKEQPV
uniref:Uncharacterized protein n=1 Tax=Alexandrium monilatum TaxID=311494 RepID=A0A7S4SVN3_9DINO